MTGADGGPSGDAGATLDAGRRDAGPQDAGPQDGGPTDAGPTDAGPSDAGPTDAGPSDAGPTDAGPTDGGACDCIGSTLTWGYEGGLTVVRRGAEIRPCGDFSYSVTMGTGPTRMCTNAVPCVGDEEVTMAEVLAALADSDVQSALTTGRPIVYGRDPRVFDGQVFIVEYEGKRIVVGSPCGGTSDCIPIPTGVQMLKDVLESLQDERLATEPCLSTFPPT